MSAGYEHTTVDLLGFAQRELADVTKRQAQAQRRATGREPLMPGMGSPAHWQTEARRLQELVDHHQAKVDDLIVRLTNDQTTEPF